MRPNRLRELKAARRPIVAAWLSIGSSYLAEIAAHADVDAVVIDRQHGMIGFETMVSMLQAISTTRAVPLVRPARNDAAEIMRYLDAGAYGVICPMISTAVEAASLVAACRYPPTGVRSYGPARALLYGGLDYLGHSDRHVLAIAMIETREALDALDAIVATPGLDGVFVGPNDLGLALGIDIAAASRDPAMHAATAKVREAAVARGLIAGIFASGGAGAAARIAEGFDLVTLGSDALLLKAAFATAAEMARR